MVERRISFTTQKCRRNSDEGAPNGGAKCRWCRKNCVFRTVEKSPAQKPHRRNILCSSATMVRVHEGVLAKG